MRENYTGNEDRLLHARLLVELRDLQEASLLIADILEDDASMVDALNLLARIKHMRGELSQAVTCWAQLLAYSPVAERSIQQLRAIMHVAKDPERGGGEFLALGPFQLARKPAAQLALEDAFQLVLNRQPDAARARCRELAARYRAKDQDTYKLAVLAEAWIAELSGEFSDACEILERLGRERGFETDIDRVVSLERVYEHLGTAEALEAAVNICLYLERTYRKLSVLSRLAWLQRKLGRASLADEYDARYLVAFRRRMHRLTLGEVVRAAARHYVPLHRLVGVRWYGAEIGTEATPRERAIALCMQNDHDGTRQLLEGGGETLDRVYLADLAALDGDEVRAVDGYLEALREVPWDLSMIEALLDHPQRCAMTPVRVWLEEPANNRQVRDVIENALRAGPRRAALWRMLSVGEQARGNEAGRQQALERALTISESDLRDRNPIGRVLAAAIYQFIAKAKGLIHEVWATRQAASPGRGGWLPSENILGNLTAEMKEGVRNTFLAVREYARTKFPHMTGDILDYTYTFKVTKEDEPSSGLSAGLPTALAFLSVFLQRPVPQDLAATGFLVTDAHDVLTIRGVGDIEYKVKAGYHRGLRMMILPRENRPELLGSSMVPVPIVEELVRFAANLDEAVQLAFGAEIFVEGISPRRGQRPGSVFPPPG